MARRVLALALLGLALVVCGALAASESLANRTGRTATAVTVTFSEQVRITSYDESVFPTKDPSSRSETFRFSGGQLDNGARFAVSWTPSGAEITGTEWETTGSASAGSTASGAPLTYEQIMAQVAHYPGPDAPLYVPAEGEQIWLTDLEGHADIYDNDSIRINYAPGFDKSQITRIDVYRNGVKMRFVPALFDALTNEQMKTFDGNPAENTPASSHTDHAIMGYSYSFRFYTATLSMVEKALVTTIKSGVTWRPGYVYALITSYWNWTMDVYALSDSEISQFLGALRAKGFNGISVDVMFAASARTSNEIETLFWRPGLDWWLYTPTLEQCHRIFTLAREADLEVEARIHFWPPQHSTDPNFGYSGSIEPSNFSVWLQNYQDVIGPYIRVMNETGVRTLVPLVEMEGITEQHDAWTTAFLSKIAPMFDGDTIRIDQIEAYVREGTLDLAGKFWAWADGTRKLVRGLTVWGEQYETQKDQRLSVLTSGFVNFWSDALIHFSGLAPGHEIVWGEIGTFPVDGIGMGYEHYPLLPTMDVQEFNDVMAAYLLGSAVLPIDGASLWFFPLCDVEALRTDNSAILTGSSTMALISSIIGPSRVRSSTVSGSSSEKVRSLSNTGSQPNSHLLFRHACTTLNSPWSEDERSFRAAASQATPLLLSSLTMR